MKCKNTSKVRTKYVTHTLDLLSPVGEPFTFSIVTSAPTEEELASENYECLINKYSDYLQTKKFFRAIVSAKNPPFSPYRESRNGNEVPSFLSINVPFFLSDKKEEPDFSVKITFIVVNFFGVTTRLTKANTKRPENVQTVILNKYFHANKTFLPAKEYSLDFRDGVGWKWDEFFMSIVSSPIGVVGGYPNPKKLNDTYLMPPEEEENILNLLEGGLFSDEHLKTIKEFSNSPYFSIKPVSDAYIFFSREIILL